jgi:hypothetical protein
MASRDVILLNMAMAVIICLHAFGGERPMVSLSTAVAGGFLQLYFFVANTLVSRVVPKQKKMEESSTSSVTDMVRNGVSCMVAQLTTITQNPRFQQLGGMFALLMVGRILRTSGVLTSATQAVPLALVLGLLCLFVMTRASSEDASVDEDDIVAHLTAAKDTPYNAAFWSELGSPATNAEPIDKVSLDPSDILADVYHDLVLK